MMLELQCQIADVRARDLGVLWNAALPEVLAEKQFPHSAGTLHLGVIGASHVASVYGAAGLLFREEISCNAREQGLPLPPDYIAHNYRLHTAVEKLDDVAFIHRASIISALADNKSSALVVQFPGEGKFHITALEATVTHCGWNWTTYHIYPAENTIVTTWSSYTL